MLSHTGLKGLCASTLLVLCSQGAAGAESVVRVAMTAGDIPLTAGVPDQGFEGYRFVSNNLYDGLLRWDLTRTDVPSELKPALATSWYVDPDNNKRWIFELREGVTYHDGCPFNADSAVWNFERLTQEDHPEFNARQFGLARARTLSIESIEKIDDYKIAINTKEPDSIFYLQTSFIPLVSDCKIKELAGDVDKFALSPVGTGPYKFDKMTPGERLELVPNTEYWDEARIPKHDRLVLTPMPEATTRAAALMSGQVDFIEAPSPDTIPMLEGAGMKIFTAPYPHNWGYNLNFVDGPFKDIRVRRAANYALNREEIVALLGGYALPGYAALPPGSEHFGEPTHYAFDTEKATELLKEAGCYPCEVTFAISSSGSGQMQPLPMNELVKTQLEAAGFRVTLDVMDWNKLTEVARQGREAYPQYDAINVSRALQDPLSGLFRFMMKAQWGPAGGNFGHYYNEDAEKLIAEIYETFDEEKRNALITKAHEMMVDEAVMIFAVHDINPRALSPKLEGFVQAQSWFQDLNPITVQP